VVNAKDKDAADFYRHHGFMMTARDDLTLFLPLATAQALEDKNEKWNTYVYEAIRELLLYIKSNPFFKVRFMGQYKADLVGIHGYELSRICPPPPPINCDI
jgi:hypothetical protein